MKTLLFLLTLIPYLSLIMAIGPEKTSNINSSSLYKNDTLSELTDSNYDKIITKHKDIFVLFIATKCDNSAQALYVFQEADKIMKTKKNPVPFARIEIS